MLALSEGQGESTDTPYANDVLYSQSPEKT